MYYHTRKAHKKYLSFPPSITCHFCDPPKHFVRIVTETEHAWVVENRTHYSQWELRKVTDHLMVLPKSHVLSLQGLNPAERTDIIDIIADYEARGYEIYARSPKSVSRSVPHQHTHLIKTEGKAGRGLLFMKRPYILWRW